MTESEVNPRPKVIDRFSPSLANRLLGCSLRVAFERDPGLTDLARPTPSTALGNTAHELTEQAYKRSRWSPTEDGHRAQLEQAWDGLIAKHQRQLEEAWTPAQPPPPPEWPGYQLTRSRTIRRAQRLLGRSSPGSGPTPGTGVEVTISDPVSGLWGRADRIDQTEQGCRVVDLKSGIHQGDPSADQRRQLLLYAVLVQRTQGHWPVEIAIEDASGERHRTHLDPAEADAALAEVSTAVAAFNARASSGDSFETQATPTADRCRWCPQRLRCRPYWNELRLDWKHPTASGRVIESGTAESGGSYLILDLTSPSDAPISELHISGLATPVAKSARHASVVDLIRSPSNSKVSARWSTRVSAT